MASLIIYQGGPVVSRTANAPTTCMTHIYDVDYTVDTYWKGPCVSGSKMNCGCGPHQSGCISNTVVCIPRGDYRRIVVNVTDASGDPVDVSGFTQAEYIVAVNVDSAPILTKTLGSGIVLGGDNASYVITISEADSAAFPRDYIYHEFRLTNGDQGQTMFAGTFRTQKTILGVD